MCCLWPTAHTLRTVPLQDVERCRHFLMPEVVGSRFLLLGNLRVHYLKSRWQKQFLGGKVCNLALGMVACKLLTRAAITNTAGQTPALTPTDMALKWILRLPGGEDGKNTTLDICQVFRHQATGESGEGLFSKSQFQNQFLLCFSQHWLVWKLRTHQQLSAILVKNTGLRVPQTWDDSRLCHLLAVCHGTNYMACQSLSVL
jgi:hypothetical protein